MNDEKLPMEDTIADHEDAAEPTLGGEVSPSSLGPMDLSLPERYASDDLRPSTATERDGDSRNADERGVGPSAEG